MAMTDAYELSRWIRERSSFYGFAACGISRAGYLAEEAGRLSHWLENGYHAGMFFMTRYSDKRTDPTLLMKGTRSVISLLVVYNPGETLSAEDNYKIARYAYGKDYHLVLKQKLWALVTELRGIAPAFKVRVYCDSAPFLEKAWAATSGLGWIGKNTCLIHPKHGSFVFISEIITDLELEPDRQKVNDLCGGCNKCIDACPTGAIIAPFTLDAGKCISYHTIENRGEIPPSLRNMFHDWIFGCDICQEVCPWNRKAGPHHEPAFDPSPNLREMRKPSWEALGRQDYDELFTESAVERTGFDGLKRNIRYLSENG